MKCNYKQTTTFYFLFFVFFLFASSGVEAQSSANFYYKDEVYDEMYRSYQLGDIQRILDLFKEKCLVKGDHYQEKSEFRSVRGRIRADIYELVIKGYVALDMHERAEFFMRRLFAIRYDEDFTNYWLAFRNARDELFYVSPSIMVGAYLGLNGSVVDPKKQYAILEPTNPALGQTYTKTYYRSPEWFNRPSMIGWHLGLHGELGITKNISTNFRFQYNSYKFGYSAVNSWVNNLEIKPNSNRAQFVEYEYEHLHTLGYVQTYAGIEYRFVKRRLQPKLHLGGFYNRLFNAEKNVSFEEKPGFVDPQGNKVYFTGNEVNNILNIEQNLARSYWGISGAAGMAYRFEYFYLKFEARYHLGLQNIIIPENRLAVVELVYGFHDLFDDLHLRNFEATFGVYVPLSYRAFRKGFKKVSYIP